MNATIHQLNGRSFLEARAAGEWVTSLELCVAADITYRQVDYWTRTNLLTPIGDPTPGHGHLRRYPTSQVGRAIGVRELLDGGISLRTIRRVIDEFTTNGHAVIGDLTITRNPTHQENTPS